MAKLAQPRVPSIFQPTSVLADLAPVLDKPPVFPYKTGYMKVKLVYLTSEPYHIRAVMLKQQYNLPGPYLEETCVLLTRQKVFDLLESFLPTFKTLQNTGVISNTAVLQKFQLLDEDVNTLAYLL